MIVLTRIAKIISDRGYSSRRKAEEYIASGIVFANGKKVAEPSEKFTEDAEIVIDGKLLPQKSENPRLWLYYKPLGLITTHKDPEGRPTVFENLPIKLDKKIISVGRLDINSEGLLLLTDSGELARKFELPSSGMERTYKVRAHGYFDKKTFEKASSGIVIDGIRYRPAKIKRCDEDVGQRRSSSNNWFEITVTEGKNREVRKIFEALGLTVNRLIRISYGPYILGDMKVSEMREVDMNSAGNFGVNCSARKLMY